MGSAELWPQTLPERDAYSRGLAANAAQQSLSCFPPTCSKASVVEKPSWIFSGLTVDSLSNMLSRNDETGHQPFHLTLFQIARAASRFITLTWFILIPIYGFCLPEECGGYT